MGVQVVASHTAQHAVQHSTGQSRRPPRLASGSTILRSPGRAMVQVSASHHHSTAQKVAAVRTQLQQSRQQHTSTHWQQQRRAEVERSLTFRTLTTSPQHQAQQPIQHHPQPQQQNHHHHQQQQPGWPERPVRPEPLWQHERQQHEQWLQAEQPQQQQQQQQRAHVASAPPFTQLLLAVDMLVRSNSLVDWRQATLLLQHSLVPLVSSPLHAHQAWVCISRLAARPLKGQTARLLAAALVELVQVSLAHNDHNILQRLVAACSAPPDNGGLRISLSPRHVHDLVAAAADAGADGPTLRALLDLAPACQLSSRAYFAAIATAVNRGHASEALACANKWQDTGLRATPALSRLLARAKPAAVSSGGGAGVGGSF